MQTSQTLNTILIDDNDPSIQYDLGWVNKPSLLTLSDPKYPMYGTLHETINQTDLTYSFFGSSITACAKVTRNTSAQTDFGVLWTCSVDRVQISTDIVYDTRGSCSYNGVDSSLCCTLTVDLNPQVQHEIHISANGSQDQRISFDYLTYETSSPVPVADLLILPDDPTFRNIEGWEVQYSDSTTMDIDAIISTGPKANFTYDFYGSSILWFGFYNTTFTGYSASGFSFSIDSNPITGTSAGILDPSVAMRALNGSISEQFLVFSTFALPRGQHRLEINYTSYSGKAIPLTLTKLVVQDSMINPNSSVPTTTPTSATPSAATNGARRPHLAIILGSSGAAILVLLILGIFCARRRMRRRDRASAESGTSSLIEPFNHEPSSAPVGTHKKGQPPSELHEQGVIETTEVQVEAPPSYVTGPNDS